MFIEVFLVLLLAVIVIYGLIELAKAVFSVLRHPDVAAIAEETVESLREELERTRIERDAAMRLLRRMEAKHGC